VTPEDPSVRVPWPLRALRALVFSPPGAGLVLFLFALAFVPQPPSEIAGDRSAFEYLLRVYGSTLAAITLGVAAAHALAGLALGALASLVLGAWDAALGRGDVSRRRRWLETLALVALVEGALLLRVLARYPQLFDTWLYEAGGSRRTLALGIVRHVDLGSLEIGLCFAAGALVLGPLAFARGRARARELVRRRRLESVVALSLVANPFFALALTAEGPRPASVDPARPDILMIGVDSLRPDRLAPGIAPNMARFAGASVRFAGAHTSLPRTYSSLTDLMTGRWPQHHGIRHMFPSREERERAGPALGHALRARGYTTAGVTHDDVGAFAELDLGFDEHDRELSGGLRNELAASLTRRHLALLPFTSTETAHRLFPVLDSDWWNWDPERLADRTLETLARARSRGPAFVCAFFLTTHLPYAAPAPWCRRFTDPAYAGDFGFDAFDETRQSVPRSEADAVQLRALYDGAVAATDAAVGKILEELDRTERGRRTIVVLFSDHGQNLGELDRGFGHGNHLRGERSLETVLAVRVPGLAPRVVPGIVRDVDVAPTLAALAGTRLEGADGVDLAPLLRGEKTDLGLDAPSESELRFASPEVDEIELAQGRVGFLWAEGDFVVVRPELRERVLYAKERALRSGSWKLHYKPTTKGPRWRLYDLASDPDETRDVSGEHPELFRQLQSRLVAWATQDGSVFEDEQLKPRKGFVLDAR
jgi:arylsulfatase A-like enzyme